MKFVFTVVILFVVACYVDSQGWIDLYQFVEPAVNVVKGIFGG